MRRLERQFGKRRATAIRRLITTFRSLDYPNGTSRYYALELQAVLESGALLASLAVCASLLEIVVRELVLDYMRNTASRHRDLQAELEAQRHISFATLVEALREVGRVLADDAKAAKSFHDTVRAKKMYRESFLAPCWPQLTVASSKLPEACLDESYSRRCHCETGKARRLKNWNVRGCCENSVGES